MGENIALGLFLLLPAVIGGLLRLFFRQGKGHRAPAGWPRLIIGNLLVLFFLASFLPLAGEIYYRFLYDTTDSLDYSKVSRRWFQRYWHTNSNGIRHPMEYEPPLPQGRRRITFVGDSFTAGHGIKDVEYRFVDRIQRAHPEWDVHMIAMPGYDTGQELEAMKAFFAIGYQVDMVVLIYCLNDVSDMMPERYGALQRILAEDRQSGWLRKNSYFVNILYHRWNVRREPFLRKYYDFVRVGYEGPLWEKQQERLKAFQKLIHAHDGRLAVVTFPFLHAMGPHYDYRNAHEALNRHWQALQVPHLDLLPLYRDLTPEKITVNRFDAHPNEYASLLAAKAIDPFLSRLLSEGRPLPAKSASPR